MIKTQIKNKCTFISASKMKDQGLYFATDDTYEIFTVFYEADNNAWYRVVDDTQFVRITDITTLEVSSYMFAPITIKLQAPPPDSKSLAYLKYFKKSYKEVKEMKRNLLIINIAVLALALMAAILSILN